MARNPLQKVIDVRRSELPMALLMAFYFFLVITSFWILKPLKKALFIRFYDRGGFDLLAWEFTAAQAELLAKVLNMLVALVAVVAFSWLSRRLQRAPLAMAVTSLFLAAHLVFAALLRDPGAATVWSFYLYGDLFSTVMVATFFAFLNDSVTSDVARRIYGLVGFGGVAGGVFGSTAVGALIERVEEPGWLGVCFVLGCVILAVAWAAGRRVRPAAEASPDADDAPSGSAFSRSLRGGALVLRSSYLLAIVAIVGLYEIVSTVMDFQFTSTVAHFLDGEAIDRHFSLVFAITNVVSMIVQLVLTSFVMSRLGVGVALLVLPATVLMGSTTFLALPMLWTGSLLNTADNGFSYSINQSAKEALYVPTTREEKYQAKAFIDMFVQRFAKAFAVVLSLVLTQIFDHFGAVRFLSLLTVALTVGWVLAARHAGRCFQVKEAEPRD